MRADLRMLGAYAVVVAMSVASRASGQEPPPPADPPAALWSDAAARPPPAALTPVARPAVARFDDETPEAHAAARLYMPTDARAEPNDAGPLVAHLPVGAIVTRLASRGSAVLVELDDRENGNSRLGWVPAISLTPSAAGLAAASTAAIVRPDGMVMVTVHIDGPAEVTLEGRRSGEWREVCHAPCDILLPLDAEYRTHGTSLRPSSSFALMPVGGRAVLHVQPVGSNAGGGAGLMVLGGVVGVFGLVIFVASGLFGDGGNASAAPGIVVGMGAVLLGIGGVVLLARGDTNVTQPLAPTTARVPTWNAKVERSPSSDATFVVPVISGSF